jgi:3-phenylpropionate/cinnamic acid dioxygenase small subunit
MGGDDMDAVVLRDTITQFLALEAMLLDEGRFEEWYALLADDILYECPVRVAGTSRSDEPVAGAYRFQDDKKILRTRIDRLSTGIAYAESPPSRTVRSVSSICILPDPNDAAVVQVSSALTVYRHRGTDAHGDTLHARRNDRLRITHEGVKLARRTIIFAEVSLSTPNLAIFF